MKLLSKLFKIPQKEPLPNRVSSDESNIIFWSNESLLFTLNYKDISEVIAYKDDLFSYDEVCVGFVLRGRNEYRWAGEEMEGYKELISHLPSIFSGIRTDWWQTVAVPAFERNQITIWKEPTHTEIKPETEQGGRGNANKSCSSPWRKKSPP